MLPPLSLLCQMLKDTIACKAAQGHDLQGLQIELERMAPGYDAYAAFAEKVAAAPLRADWPYVEPNELDEIWRECDPARPLGLLKPLDPADTTARVREAFLAAIAGCILGKPLEINPTLEEIRRAAEAVGEWPLDNYASEAMLEALGRRHGSWTDTTRGRIQYVTGDDDINYDLLGMLVLERHGISFTKQNLMQLWLHFLPAGWTFGPERYEIIKAAMHSLQGWPVPPAPFDDFVRLWNPNDELCGAAIRTDAYGYACAGRPALAAELTWRDASWTHRRTGIYGSMFIAAAIATAFVERDRLAIFRTALQFVPRRSRFHEITSDCLGMVATASDWLNGYEHIHAKYAQYGHCRIYQEVGTLMNTMRFAPSVDEGICMQVAQGCDTDCFGEIAGSLLGAYFGPGHFDHQRWIAPFRDRVVPGLADFRETSLSALADRMSRLPALVAEQLA